MATHGEHEYIYPTSSVFLVREPYLQMAEGGQPMIRIDSPTDFVFLHEQTNLKGLPGRGRSFPSSRSRPNARNRRYRSIPTPARCSGTS